MKCWCLFFSFICASLLAGAALATEQPNAAAKPASREDLEKQFAETLSGSTLVGHFTTGAHSGEQPLKEERYSIAKVSKLTGETWLFETRIQYGDHDLKLPLPIEVKWAGDTPVITLTDLNVPGLGTFTARVLIHRGQYAGTWSGGDHGGQLFGQIVKGEAGSAPSPDKSKPAGASPKPAPIRK